MRERAGARESENRRKGRRRKARGEQGKERGRARKRKRVIAACMCVRERERRLRCSAAASAAVKWTRKDADGSRRGVGGREGRAGPQPMRSASGRARDSTPPSVVMATGETREDPAREFAVVGSRSVSGVALVGSRSLVGPKYSRIEAVVEYHLSSPPLACAGTSAREEA